MKKLSLILYLVLMVLLPSSAPAFLLGDMEASIGAWQHFPKGYVSYQSDDQIDFQDVLGYDKEINFLGRSKLNLPLMLPNIYLMAAPMKFETASVVDDFYDFGNIVIIPGIDFKSKFIMNQYDIGLYYDIPLLETISFKWLNIEAGLNARIIDAEATVIQDTLIPGFAIKESEKEFVIIPMLYLGICLQPAEKFAFEGEFRGLSYHKSDLHSLIGRLKMNIHGPLFIAGGYRYDTGHSDISDFKFNVDFYGFFFETGFSFN